MYDSRGKLVKYFKDVPSVLQKLKADGYTLAVASRTGAIRDAETLLSMFDWNKYFTYKEIYPGSKVKHFNK